MGKMAFGRAAKRRLLLIGMVTPSALCGSAALSVCPAPSEVSAMPAAVPPSQSPLFLDSVVGLPQVSVGAIKAVSAVTFPSASTSLGIEEVENNRIEGLRRLSEIAPNFYMPQYGSRMTSSVYVRGLGTRIEQPVVGLNIDNVPMLNKNSFDFDFPDISKIEMIRGPQSILYGRNSMGGVVNINTLSPLQYKGIRAMAGYSSGTTIRAAASAYMSPTEHFGVAVTGGWNSSNGFFRNAYTGRRTDRERQALGKLKAAWKPSQRFILENSAWITHTSQGGYAYESVETGLISHNDTCYYNRLQVVDGLTMRYFADKFSLSSISSVQYLNDDMTLDQDFLPDDYFTMKQKTHELGLTQDFVGKGHVGAWKWLGGLTGFYKRNSMHAPVCFHDYGISSLIESNINASLPSGMKLLWDERNLLLDSRFTIPTWGLAAYHKSEFALGRFTAAAGLRLAFERTDIRYNSSVNTSATMYRSTPMGEIPVATRPIDLTLADRLHQTSLQLLPELKLSYRLSDATRIGLIVSKGYKSGGYNTQMFSDILQQQMMGSHGAVAGYDPEEIISYRPEFSWNYEIDFAASLPEARLDIEAAAFLIDCRDQQMTRFLEGATGRMMTNAGRTRSLGIELSAVWSPWQHWRLNASYGLADARFRRYNNGKTDCRGRHVPYAPENTLFASSTYTIDTRWHPVSSIDATISVRGLGNIWWDDENSLHQPFYAMLGASLTLRTPLLDIDLWGENLTDTRYSTFYFESIGHRFVQRGNPRRFGITLRYNL